MLMGLQWLLGGFFLVAGALKLVAHPHMVKEFRQFQYPLWLMRLAGGIEVVAAPGLLLGVWFPWWSLAGALLLCGVMVGATYTNFVKRPPVFGWGTLIILLLCAVLVWAQRDLLSALSGWILAAIAG